MLKSGKTVFCLFVEVVPKDTRKLLLITSEVMFYNKTDQTIDIRFFECEDDTEKNEMVYSPNLHSSNSLNPFEP